MRVLTEEDFLRDPSQLLAAVDAANDYATILDKNGKSLLLALPLRGQPPLGELLLDVATTLYGYGRIDLGTAARIAGVSDSRLIDEIGRRGSLVVGQTNDRLAMDLEDVRSDTDG